MSHPQPLSASLTLRGFDMDPQEVQSQFQLTAKATGKRGQLVRPGVTTRLVRSYVQFAVDADPSKNVVDMIPMLLLALGGIDHVSEIRKRVRAEFVDVNLALPFKRSDEQSSGWIDQDSISALHRLGATLAIEVL